MTAIRFEDVTKVYSDGTVAIENVSYEVEEGTTTVLVGPSGCGKTTTMKLVNRLEDPSGGTVYYEGSDVEELDRIDLRRDIGYVIQEIGLFGHMTVGENIATVPELKGWDESRIDERIDELLELMDMPPEDYCDQYPRELSGGQRQRVGIARALASEPDVMLMDEPFGALDPITRENLQDEFLELQQQIDTTILFVTHSIDEALKMGDKIAIYDVGQVVQYDTPQEILENPANEFVEDFVGADRGLKRLQVTQVQTIMSEPGAEADTGTAIAADGNGKMDVTLSPADSAQVALSRMIQHDVEKLPVVADSAVVGTVTKDTIHNIARRGD
ncbi:ABC transporter ATP-binding protein [Haloferax denitrificans]|nr:ABC transporter ATP-binding protein [Haloferax denitrificans]